MVSTKREDKSYKKVRCFYFRVCSSLSIRVCKSATSETAYLFLQHFIKMLKFNGRCGFVIKNTFLSNTDYASIALRNQLLEECNLFAVLDFPGSAIFSRGLSFASLD